MGPSTGCTTGDSGARASEPEPSTTTTEALSAADGSDVGACGDGACEILVAARRVTIPLDEAIAVALQLDTVTIESNDGRVLVRGLHPDGGETRVEPADAESSAFMYGLTITPIATDGDRVVVALSVGDPAPGAAVAPGDLVVEG
jgi:hypothetical protein